MQARRQENGVDGAFLWKCELCARVCPRGAAPLPVRIKT
jgi:ferredoxin